MISRGIHPEKTETVLYDQSTSVTTNQKTRTVTRYEYTPLLQLSRQTVGEPGVDKLYFTDYRYPTSYDLTGLNTTGNYNSMYYALSTMQDQHVHSPVIEQTTAVQDVGEATPRVLTATLNHYSPRNLLSAVTRQNASVALPTLTQQFRSPAGVTDFRAAGFTGSEQDLQFSRDDRYRDLLRIDHYNQYGKVLQQTPRQKSPETYVWGYGVGPTYEAVLPTARVENAAIDQVAYTSFERLPNSGSAEGEWAYISTDYDAKAKTGTYVHSLLEHEYTGILFEGWVTKVNLPIGEYRLSYWGKEGSVSATINAGSVRAVRPPTAADADGWVYYEDRVTVTSSSNQLKLSGTAKVDEVRLHPIDAQMTSFTHQMAVGLTATTDPAGTSSYYEYDGYQRLRLIRDHNRDIVKQIRYWYPGQDAPGWRDTGKVRCSLGSDGNPTGLQEKEQKDYNIDGPSYNQIRWVSDGSSSVCRPCREGEKFDGVACRPGLRVNDSSRRNSNGTYECYYHYEFFDGTSSETYSENISQSCVSDEDKDDKPRR